MDVYGGQLIQSNGNPIFPGTRFTGPLLAGNIFHSSGPGLAGLGSTNLNTLANVGYAKMAQMGRVLQTAGAGFASPDLVIPAQSMIVSISSIVLAAFTGAAATFGIGSSVNPIALTPAGAMTAPQAEVISAAVPPQLGNWINVGAADMQLVFIASNAGTGAALVTVEYIQGINAPTS